ncbi:MAG TPA: indolepyruvate oxidoreductase subunit beta [Anaerolineae bacterium]|nr:indolepyruvate oxidoreductase subunit beta [Anaerolineae bacterium]
MTNFLITGVGGQGTILASDILAAVGLASGHDVKKSDILGLAVRGGAVVGHVRWGSEVHSPIVPEGRVDYLVAFEILEGLRWLNQVRPDGVVLLNQQEIHPVTVSSGLLDYPSQESGDRALEASTDNVYRVPGLDLAQALGNARVLNVVLLGALSALLPLAQEVWESVVKERVPGRYTDLNLRAFHSGREWLQERR